MWKVRLKIEGTKKCEQQRRTARSCCAFKSLASKYFLSGSTWWCLNEPEQKKKSEENRIFTLSYRYAYNGNFFFPRNKCFFKEWMSSYKGKKSLLRVICFSALRDGRHTKKIWGIRTILPPTPPHCWGEICRRLYKNGWWMNECSPLLLLNWTSGDED